jgi:hypothetical protein
MTEIPETIYSRARSALAYAQTAASSGEPEKAIEIIAREIMAPQWMPVETAPRSGRMLATDGRCVEMVRWGSLHMMEQRDGKSTEKFGFVIENTYFADAKPKFWMPSPTPPEAIHD